MAAVTILPLVMSILMTPSRTTPCCQNSRSSVALAALSPSVSVFSRIYSKPAGVMIHRVRSPHRRAVARGAVVRKLLGHMILARRLLIVCYVALVAIRVLQLIIAIHVT